MESRAAVEVMMASMAALAELTDRSEGSCDATSSNPLRDQSDACLEGLEVSARLEAMLSARKVHFAAGFAAKSAALAAPAQSPGQHTAQETGVVSEVACALTVSERTASALLAQSVELTTTLPLTVEALQEGAMSWQHARAMVDEAASLDPAGAAALEAHFLDPDTADAAKRCPAGDMVPSRFRAKARAWRERHHPENIEKRHATGFLDRRLEYTPDRDGMAWLSAYLPADQAAGIWDRTTTIAKGLQGPGDDRTLPQIRADVVAKLLLSAGFTPSSPADGSTATTAGNSTGTGTMGADEVAGGVPATPSDVVAGQVPSPAAQVLVTVPVFALMGLTDEPADLDGYGPIPASMARKLVADGASSFRRVLTDPRDGAPLEIGRDSYRIPAAMRQWLRLRDRKCSFPGCNNQSLDNEADHILAWADGGTTGVSNLGSLCQKHHRLKHTTPWTPTGASNGKPPGWTSPTGRHYPSEHHDWEPPQWPAPVIDQLRPQESGKVLPGEILTGHMQHADVPSMEAMPVDPLPEWVWRSWPVDEPDPDPDEWPPYDLALPEDQLPDKPLPEDPFPDWAQFLTHDEYITA